MLASGPFYTSLFFWTVASPIICLIIGLLTVFVTLGTWRFGPPRPLLIYNMPVATSLLTMDAPSFGHASSDLKIVYCGHVLTNPYVVRLRVDSQRRKDISSLDFDQEQPVVFDLGAPIHAIASGGCVCCAARSKARYW